MKKQIPALLTVISLFCAPAVGQQVQELMFMHYLTGADGFALADLVERFNAEHPDIRVIASTTPGMVEKLLVQSAAGAPPDIALAAPEMMEVFASEGVLSPIDTRRFETLSVREDEYVPAAWESALYQGTLYGIPLGVGSIGLYINPAMFEEAGLQVAPPETSDELLVAIRRLNRDTDGDGVWNIAGLEFPFNHDIYVAWYGIFKQFGGSIFDAGGNIAFDSPAGLESLERWTALWQENGLALEPRRDFLLRQSAMTIRKAAARYNLVQSGVPYQSGPLPQFGPQPGAWAGVQSIVIPKAEHSPQKLAAIYTFIEWLGGRGYEWAVELGHLPARWDVIRMPEILDSAHHYGFAVQSMYLHVLPTDPKFAQVGNILQPMVNQAVRGNGAPKNLLEDAAQRARAAIAP